MNQFVFEIGCAFKRDVLLKEIFLSQRITSNSVFQFIYVCVLSKLYTHVVTSQTDLFSPVICFCYYATDLPFCNL